MKVLNGGSAEPTTPKAGGPVAQLGKGDSQNRFLERASGFYLTDVEPERKTLVREDTRWPGVRKSHGATFAMYGKSDMDIHRPVCKCYLWSC